MPSRANRTLVKEGPNQRDTAAPDAATASDPMAPAQPKPRRYHPAGQRNRESNARPRHRADTRHGARQP